MTSEHETQTGAAEEAVSRTFLHQGSEPAERVQPPALITPRSFRLLWIGLAAVVGVLLLVGVAVAGRVA